MSFGSSHDPWPNSSNKKIYRLVTWLANSDNMILRRSRVLNKNRCLAHMIEESLIHQVWAILKIRSKTPQKNMSLCVLFGRGGFRTRGKGLDGIDGQYTTSIIPVILKVVGHLIPSYEQMPWFFERFLSGLVPTKPCPHKSRLCKGPWAKSQLSIRALIETFCLQGAEVVVKLLSVCNDVLVNLWLHHLSHKKHTI